MHCLHRARGAGANANVQVEDEVAENISVVAEFGASSKMALVMLHGPGFFFLERHNWIHHHSEASGGHGNWAFDYLAAR